MALQVRRITAAALLGLLPLGSTAPLETSAAAEPHSDAEAGCAPGGGACERQDPQLSLLQRAAGPFGIGKRAGTTAAKSGGGKRDLALIHVPYNFGHTVENVAMFGSGPMGAVKMGMYVMTLGGFSEVKRQASWKEARRLTRPRGEVWGHLNPDLQVTSDVTGCPMYYTPQKHWPEGLAAKYFGNKTRFGMLRDPYERLVAFFRGGIKGYGGMDPKFLSTCDVSGAIKQILREYKSGNKFANGCTLLPQAEFFDGDYGIDLPINNRLFPQSMNEAFLEHGFPDFQIKTPDILHVALCPDVWAADLDTETRALVKEIYARDFELLCKHFGYCDQEENACIYQVPLMCPAKVLKAGYAGVALNSTA